MKQFLWVNGYQFKADQKDAENYTVFLVVEKPQIKDVADWIEKHSEPR